MGVSAFLSLCTAIGQLALWALFWYFVVDLLTMMPETIRRIFKGIIIMLAIFYSLQDVLAVHYSSVPYCPLVSPTPSIMAPEHR
jgi:hypothetical protein